MPLFPFEKGTFLYIFTYIVLITPIYQVLLLAYAFLFGKFSFFWEKQKKMGRWIGKKWVWSNPNKSLSRIIDDFLSLVF